MIRKGRQGNVKWYELDGMIHVDLLGFVVSIGAFRKDADGNAQFDHDAFVETRAKSKDHAKAIGLAKAKLKWKESDGWDYRIKARPFNLTYEFANDKDEN